MPSCEITERFATLHFWMREREAELRFGKKRVLIQKVVIPEREERLSWGSLFSYQKLDSLLALRALWNDKNQHERALWSEKIGMNVLYGVTKMGDGELWNDERLA